jgi:hypothetical protein
VDDFFLDAHGLWERGNAVVQFICSGMLGQQYLAAWRKQPKPLFGAIQWLL